MIYPPSDRFKPVTLSSTIRISTALRRQLVAERNRTGVRPRKLLKNVSDVPKGLIHGAVSRWLSGIIREAPEHHFNYVIALWSALPDDKGRTSGDGLYVGMNREGNDDYVVITEEMSAMLRFEFKRTGLTPMGLIKLLPRNPDRLSVEMVRSWRDRKSTSAHRVFWSLVIDTLSRASAKRVALPIRESPRKTTEGSRPLHRPITDEQWMLLKLHHNRTGLSPARIIKLADNVPIGVNVGLISSWLSGSTRSALPEYIDFVINLYKYAPSKAG